MPVQCEILASGALRVTADEETRAEIAAGLERSYWGAMADAFEHYSCNGSFTPFDAGDANPSVGLTSAPCVAESLSVLDDGTREIDGRLWWFPDYAIRDPLDELVEIGETTFASADDGH